MVKLNAIVPEATRDAIRATVREHKTTVQAVVMLALTLGLEEIGSLSPDELHARLLPDGRKK